LLTVVVACLINIETNTTKGARKPDAFCGEVINLWCNLFSTIESLQKACHPRVVLSGIHAPKTWIPD